MPKRRLVVKAGPGAVVRHGQGIGFPRSPDTFEVEGDFTYEVEDIDRYLQVQVQGYGRLYTYRDPAGELSTIKVGDLVEVPFGPNDSLRTGSVTAIGRGSFTGQAKDVAHKLLRSRTYTNRVIREGRRNSR